ncbi:MAG: hypothetical protein ACXW18_09505 [Pyrinomonadaceae bacterium]
MVLFPPWLFVFDPPAADDVFRKTTRPGGYHLLFSPHMAEDEAKLAQVFSLPPARARRLVDFSVVMDRDRLTVQIIGVLVITVLLTVLLKSKNTLAQPQ